MSCIIVINRYYVMNQAPVITVHDDDFVSSIQLQNELGLDINNTSSGDVESDIYDEHCDHDPGL